ncbi:hypothetical protein CKY04_18475 [Photorhabdus sp. S8-52]|nr:hypothetical protein CKY03_18970 [Photorhabdus sp. S9-53]RAW94984.1 hypothetical protein CKY05_18760 [Photorhabdus sp. S10-54]RAW99146.1 hypothetical protein CKY04_18475 [Photorhabdus sp. S8-52]
MGIVASCVNVVLSAGQCHESQYAIRLLDGLGIQRKNGFMKRRSKAVIADKGYASHSLLITQPVKTSGNKSDNSL